MSNFERLYLIRHESGRFFHKLYVSVAPSLYYYFRGRSHVTRTIWDYVSFVTPEAVEPIAKELQKISNSDENFVNIVLKVIRQIPYSKSGPKYPVETIVEHNGDCGALSILAASIIKAGGIDVALLYYESGDSGHMALGVSLPRDPINYRSHFTPKFYEYHGKRYWVAECAGYSDWRVGEEPPSLNGVKVTVIPINGGCLSPASISASLNTPLERSSITVNIYRSTFNISSDAYRLSDYAYNIKVYGRVIPIMENCKVTIYIFNRDFSLNHYIETYTDKHGWYWLSVNLTMPGVYHVIASCNGLVGRSGADSDAMTLLLGPKSIAQFKGPWFNYTMGRYGLFGLEIRKAIGLRSFFNISFPVNETKITFSFLTLKGAFLQDSFEFENETLTFYSLEPLRLPEDFDARVRRFLTLAVNRSEDGLNISFMGLSQKELQILSVQDNKSSPTPILNVTTFINNEVWYEIALESVNYTTTIKLYSHSYGLIWLSSVEGNGTLYILLADIKDSLVAFRGLWIKIPPQPEKILESLPPESSWYLLLSTAAFMMFMIITSVFIMDFLERARNPIINNHNGLL
ncbi:MAG: hypothetical protein QXO20_03960 [Candidatus Bathyarchaeia archaeon]